MDIRNKTVVVTGGGSGIGAALCRRFAQENVKGVAVADIDLDGAQNIASEISKDTVAMALRCDVAKEEDIVNLIAETEKNLGPVDVFCSNAGILMLGDFTASDEQWQKTWGVNVMSHVYAARAVIPGMVKRGGGAFICTASAAGLLNMIESGMYAVSKHAALGFIENLAINYGDKGIYAAAICPMAVKSKMTANGGGSAGMDGILDAEEVADHVMRAMTEDRFLILPHPEVKQYIKHKAADTDKWIGGMRNFKKACETKMIIPKT